MIKKENQKNMKDYDKRKRHKSNKLPVNCTSISSNNFRHPVTKTFTTLRYTSPNFVLQSYTLNC